MEILKKLLILLLFGICAIGWRSETIMRQLGLMKTTSESQSYSIESLTATRDPKAPQSMSLTQYAELAKTDPDAYRKLIQSHQQEQERSEIDKLMNFFAHLKYE
ncbi:MAG TPA: hypothetical protein VIF82_03725 [Burkholderiaceae bacterium]|jgi:hypothetical protein